MPLDLSIVIPTHKRETLLKVLLDSIIEQTCQWSRFEVIVVDNYPEPYQPTQDLCSSGNYSALNIRCENDPVLGSSEARNFGAKLAKAPWVAFIDDDEKLPAHWVERAFEIIENYAPDIFGGPYHPYYLDPRPSWFQDQYLTLTLSKDKGWVKDERNLFGGNIVFRKTCLDQLGGFSVEYGRTGHNREYGEETEIQMRAHRLEMSFYYDPDLYIFHYVHPERLHPGWFLTSAWYHGKAKARMAAGAVNTAGGSKGLRLILSRFKKLIPDAWKVAGLYARLPFRDQKKAPFAQNYLVQTIAPSISVLAMSWYLFAYSFKRKG
jgi:glucosyl-dolichyl phosphate glucuronosyltransferase